MKFDDVSWHERTDKPEYRAVHVGLYVRWLAENDLLSDDHRAQAGEALEALRSGRGDSYDYANDQCDGKLVDEDLSPEGLRFTTAYYRAEYGGDFTVAAMQAEQSGSSDTYQLLRQRLDTQLQRWRQGVAFEATTQPSAARRIGCLVIVVVLLALAAWAVVWFLDQ